MKKIIGVVVLILLLSGVFYFWKNANAKQYLNENFSDQLSFKEESNTLNLSGSWTSVNDESFVRVFNEDSTFKDMYQSEVVASGTWFTFNKNNSLENFPYDVEDGKDYLIMNDTSSTLSFVVSEHTNDSLVINYLDSGGVLKFKK